MYLINYIYSQSQSIVSIPMYKVAITSNRSERVTLTSISLLCARILIRSLYTHEREVLLLRRRLEQPSRMKDKNSVDGEHDYASVEDVKEPLGGHNSSIPSVAQFDGSIYGPAIEDKY